jgi:hypothetical protein
LKLIYRPEIDGLRALAVVFVVLYHLEFIYLNRNFFQGGFLGVDIFFVISGYLASHFIFPNLKKVNKSWIFLYYEKRARRIFPALFSCILVSFIFAYFNFLQDSFSDFKESIIYCISFLSNIYFYYTRILYGAEDSVLIPLLHTWSLAIEFQFYIFFPIILILINKYLRQNIILLIFLLFFLSFFIFILFSYKNSSLSFFFTITRLWELIIGSIIYIYEKKLFQKQFRNEKFLTFIGFFLILFALLYGEVQYFYLWNIAATLGTCLIIIFSKKEYLITELLSKKFIVFIGLISYSLYIFHYPVLAFNRYSSYIKEDFNGKLLLVLIIFLLSLISYYFFERPFRNKNNFVNRKIFYYLVFFFLLIILFLSTIKNSYLNSKFFIPKDFFLNKNKYLIEYNLKKSQIGIPDFSDDNKIRILIIGNSHATDTFNIISFNTNLLKKYSFSIFHPNEKNIKIHNYEVHCLLNFIKYKIITCDNQEGSLKYIDLYNKSQIIIISTKWKEKDLDSLEEIINLLQRDKKKIIIFGETVTVDFSKYRLNPLDEFIYIKKRLPNDIEKLSLEKIYYSKTIFFTDNINKKLMLITKKYNITFYDKKKYFCNLQQKTCKILTDENNKIIFDNSHLTIAGAKYLSEVFSKDILNMFE